MTLKKLSSEVQSVLNASSKINNYKQAIEELVYNSLDANSTSIAIRIFIQENYIQVIDNGFGIAKSDIALLGQRYATSKLADISIYKSAPNKYGFKGESLANIIKVSNSVKIVTRYEKLNETWTKSFSRGHEKDIFLTTMRPSKGTTVDVKGFLYNQPIQRKTIDILKEIEDIKLFLQQLSLVHTNVSISLRNNSTNEIILIIHKNRSIYQSLSSLLGIEKNEIQELQIEKNEYKAIGYFGKKSTEYKYHWIYLNGRFIYKSKLHDVIQCNFTKTFDVKLEKKILKTKKLSKDVTRCYQGNIPFYFLFIQCPYFDYYINFCSKETIVEFKDWEQITKLLEKLVKFYRGDLDLKELKNNDIEKTKKIENTRKEVQKIIDKVLGNYPKQDKISQIQNGVKGKITKRKCRKKQSTNLLNISHKIGIIKKPHHLNILRSKEPMRPNRKQDSNSNNIKSPINIENVQKCNVNFLNIHQNEDKVKYQASNHHTSNNLKINKKQLKLNPGFISTGDMIHKQLSKKDRVEKKSNNPYLDKKSNIMDYEVQLINKFDTHIDSSISKRGKLHLENKKELKSKNPHKMKYQFTNNVMSSDIIKVTSIAPMRSIENSLVPHDYKQQPASFGKFNNISKKNKKYLKSYDLVNTILKNQKSNNWLTKEMENHCQSYSDHTPNFLRHFHDYRKFCSKFYNKSPHNIHTVMNQHNENTPVLTFNSHKYEKDIIVKHANKSRNQWFISHLSKDNFFNQRSLQSNQNRIVKNLKSNFQSNVTEDIGRIKVNEAANDSAKHDPIHSSYVIEFSESNYKDKNIHNSNMNNERIYSHTSDVNINQKNQSNIINTYSYEVTNYLQSTFTIIDSNASLVSHQVLDQQSSNLANKFIENIGSEIQENNDSTDKMKVVFVSKSENTNRNHLMNTYTNRNQTSDEVIQPVNICETVLNCSKSNEDINNRHGLDIIKELKSNINTKSRIIYNSKHVSKMDDYNETSYNFNDFNMINDAIDASIDVSNNYEENMELLYNGMDTIQKKSAVDAATNHNNVKDFQLQNRHNFVPKGMSPIFVNCHSKYVRSSETDIDCFNKDIYDKFAEDILINCEIFAPIVQHVDVFECKVNKKDNNKLNYGSLKFTTQTLRESNVSYSIEKDRWSSVAKFCIKSKDITKKLQHTI